MKGGFQRDELVEGVARYEIRRRRRHGRADADGGARDRRHVGRRDRVLLRDLEIHGKWPLGSGLQILQDRGQEVIFEPLLVVPVRRPQADAAVIHAHTLDRAQPKITVGGLDHRLDGTDRLGPKVKHPRHLSTARV
jgi:hypothetical protein